MEAPFNHLKYYPKLMFLGDKVKARKKAPYGIAAFHALTNLMRFQNLKQQKLQKVYSDGMIVTAHKFFNEGVVTIYVPPEKIEKIEEGIIVVGKLLVLEMNGKIWRYRDDPLGSDTNWWWYEEIGSDFRKIMVYDTAKNEMYRKIKTNDGGPAVFPIDYSEISDWYDNITDIGQPLITSTQCPTDYYPSYTGTRPWPIQDDPDLLEEGTGYNCYDVDGVLTEYKNSSLMHYSLTRSPSDIDEYNSAMDGCGTCVGYLDPDDCAWVESSCNRSYSSLSKWTDIRPRMYADILLDVYQPYQINFINSGQKSSFSRKRKTVNSAYGNYEEQATMEAYDCGDPSHSTCYRYNPYNKDWTTEAYEESTYTIETPLGVETLIVNSEYEYYHRYNLYPDNAHTWSGFNNAVTLADRYANPRAWNTSILSSGVYGGENIGKTVCQLYVQRNTKHHTVTPAWQVDALGDVGGVPEDGDEHLEQWIVVHGSINISSDMIAFDGRIQARNYFFENAVKELIDSAYTGLSELYLPEWELSQVRIVNP